MIGAVTFDFHDTLAVCDAWFELEVRHLASSFLRWQAERHGSAVGEGLLTEADVAYRGLRRHIIEHGDELPAEACVARVLEDLDVPVEPATIAQGVAALMRATLEDVRPMPGAVGTVRTLAAEGVPLGIISSAVYHPFLEWSLERFELRGAFQDVTTSASAGFYKSRPELFWHAVAALGAAPERSVHVGDSYRYDVGGARRAGMKTVWLRLDPDLSPDGGQPPDLTVASLEGAAPRILDLLGARLA